MRRDRLYLEEIVTCIRRIREYTQGGKDAFLADARTQDAVLRNIEIIGEATRNLPAEMRVAEPAIPWRDIGAMRNVLIHHYFRVELDRVWDVVERDRDPLGAAVERLLAPMRAADD